MVKDDNDNWKIVTPPLNKIADPAAIQNFFSTIATFEAIDMIDNSKNLSQYNFNPQNVFILYTKENNKITEKSLTFGKIDAQNKKIYILNNQNKAVFSVSSDFVAILLRKANVYLPAEKKQ
jgi:Domain of unknown function (DUF4340)